MKLSSKLALAPLILALSACSGFGLRSSSKPAPAAAPAAAAPAAAPAAPAAAPAATAAPAAAAPAAAAVSPTPAYYKVIDVQSGKEFYTQKVTRSGTAVVFTDEKTGAETTLQNSPVLPVQKMEYTTGIAPTPTAAPVPAAAAAPSPAAGSTPPAAPAAPDSK